MPSGKVLIAGGYGVSGASSSTAEVFDGISTFTKTTDLPNGTTLTSARISASAALLPSGKVLLVGGTSGTTEQLSSAEIHGARGDFQGHGLEPSPALGSLRIERADGVLIVLARIRVNGQGIGRRIFRGVSDQDQINEHTTIRERLDLGALENADWLEAVTSGAYQQYYESHYQDRG